MESQLISYRENIIKGIIQKGAIYKARLTFFEAVAIALPMENPLKLPDKTIPTKIIYFLKIFWNKHNQYIIVM